MPDPGIKPSPTGSFGERKAQPSAEKEVAPASSSRDSVQNFTRRPKDEPETGPQGTAKRPPNIDRATPEG